ncbi:Riboflavin transporter [Falsiruegeria litorea R37]|uniref:Riboflavin transporter n=1 Tax=Falsiruegeria litorea R37 TaxID=1200284 RepID=A0A1Y5TJ64_9RHOB|nr:DMT family transporter [Falsiruegeria litorea]SLN65213.1 Riboflavin transporter [Falsiruegeria litorea R37]
MKPHIPVDPKANLIGSAWMVVAMLGFALEDAMIKRAAADLPVWQVLVIFGLGGVAVFAMWAWAIGASLLHRDVLSRPMKVRVLFEVLGRLFYVLALALSPLSSATVILQATPLFVVAGAALFFGETVGWRRWVAIVLGMAGVVVIIQPTGDSFSPLSILAVLGMLGFAGRDLASRAAPATLGTQVLGFYGFLSIVVAGFGYRFWEAAPTTPISTATALSLAGAVTMGVIAYASLMKAMRTGEVSAVTPFRYTRLLFGIGLGIVLFGERPEQSVWLGSLLIVLSGLYILWRGRHTTSNP